MNGESLSAGELMLIEDVSSQYRVRILVEAYSA